MKMKLPLMLVLTVAVVCGAAHAEVVKPQIPFSAQFPSLTPGTTYTFRFSLYDSAKGRNEVWREEKAYPLPSSKTISHMLGSVVPFSEGMSQSPPYPPAVPVNFSEQFWVQASQGGTVLRRVKLTSVPYAINSISTYGLRVTPNDVSPNVIGGHPANRFATGVIGASIAGGGNADERNEVIGDHGAIGGGVGNTAGHWAVVGGGFHNQATGTFSSICGGIENLADNDEASVLGGAGGRATGAGSIVAGGCSNTASGYRAFAAGEDANSSRRGMFVWSATDDQDPDGGQDPRYNHVYEAGDFPHAGFPQELVGGVANPLLKEMQFWVKAPGGVFFVTGQDDAGNAQGVMLGQGSQAWTTIPLPPTASSAPLGRDSADLQALQALVADLEKRVAALEEELAAGRAESATLKARIEDLALRQVELRRLLAGGPSQGSDQAAIDLRRVIHP